MALDDILKDQCEKLDRKFRNMALLCFEVLLVIMLRK
jgi:hypothetical protein